MLCFKDDMEDKEEEGERDKREVNNTDQEEKVEEDRLEDAGTKIPKMKLSKGKTRTSRRRRSRSTLGWMWTIKLARKPWRTRVILTKSRSPRRRGMNVQKQ